MEFVAISALREASGYRDRRSITKWVRKSLDIELYKIGKNWCVVKEEYEAALQMRYALQSPTKKVSRKNASNKIVQAANPHEQWFLNDLQKFLSHV